MSVIKIENIENKILEIRGEKIILDSDIAKLYGVETKRINEAVKNNPDKFPVGYVIKLSKTELELLRSKISSTKLSKTRTVPKAFTEKGLYMLATILNSKKAVQTTLTIIETFAKIRELSRTIKDLSVLKDEKEKNRLMQKSGEIITKLFDDDLQKSESETSIEINFAVLKFKHTIKKK